MDQTVSPVDEVAEVQSISTRQDAGKIAPILWKQGDEYAVYCVHSLARQILTCNLSKRHGVTAQGSAAADVIRAKTFELVDSTGNIRGKFGTNDKGVPTLVLWDSTGKTRASLDTNDKSEAMLALFDSNGKRRASLDVFKDEPYIALCDSAGKVRGELDAINGEPGLRLYDSDGKRIWSTP
jgi:hypothetical protein